jgi:isochorismate synthase EntC
MLVARVCVAKIVANAAVVVSCRCATLISNRIPRHCGGGVVGGRGGSHEGETRLSMAAGSLWFQLHVKCDEAIEEG